MQDILDMGRDDIGSEAAEDAPRLPDESPMRDAMGRAIRAGLSPLALAMLSFRFSKKPKAPPRRTGSDRRAKPAEAPGAFVQWLMRKANAMTAASQNVRNRELNRLLGLLQKDPDTGLQFALPLHAIATRGLAPPSNSLGRRSVNFDLSKPFGGNRPGDTWAVPDDLRRQLKERYREAANRELNLGRFSRAAYIFAHLIGDFTAAADALKRSRLFREASVIYKDKLSNPKAAADCLAAGGLLLEAIPLYRSLDMHEAAGDLHARLGQPDEARQCHDAEVRQLTKQKNFIAAARIQEKKLDRPDDALALLARTWPDSDSGGVCLREWFFLCGRLGRHDDAHSRIAELSESPPTWSISTLVQGLGAVAVTYPNPRIRASAADSVRVLSGNRLLHADLAERQTLIQAVVALVPADRLLSRDGNRYLSSHHVKSQVMPIPIKGIAPRQISSFNLPRQFEYRAVVSLPGGYLAFGTRRLQAVAVRGTWDGRMKHVIAKHEATPGPYSLVAPGPGSPALIAHHWPSNIRVGPFHLPRIDVFQEDLLVETPAYLRIPCGGICRDEAGTCWVIGRDESGDLSLAAYSPSGALLSTHWLEFHQSEIPAPIAVRRGCIYIGAVETLTRYCPGGKQVNSWKMPIAIRTLTPSPSHTVTRMIACFDDGCALVADTGEYRLLAQGLINPAATFTPDGSVIVVRNGKGHVYARSGKELAFSSSFETNQKPLTVLPAKHGEFAVFDSHGNVTVHRLGSN